MASLSEDATFEDIEDEIIFQQTLLNSLDVDAENYDEERQNIEAVLQELETRVDALVKGSHNSMDGPANGLGATGGANSILGVPAVGMLLNCPFSKFTLVVTRMVWPFHIFYC